MKVGSEHVAAFRRFNRFYRRRIGVLQGGLLRSSPYSLTEARVLCELAHCNGVTTGDLARGLDLDNGYLSRIVHAFAKRGLVRREKSKSDARQRRLALSAAGRRTVARLERRSRQDVAGLLAPLSEGDRARLAGAMRTLEELLAAPAVAIAPFVLRTHRPGDMGWVTQAHGEIYWREFGWDERFEALVARIVGDFIDKFDAQRERCWIAERDGQRVGSVFLVRKSETVARLRLLIVDPRARGLGLGKALVDECVRFAAHCGYRRITLWTQRNLAAARGIYNAAGFKLVARERHWFFGIPLVGETWQLDLPRGRRSAERSNVVPLAGEGPNQ